MNKKQIETEIQWLREQLATKKLSTKNVHEYERQIRQKELDLAFENAPSAQPVASEAVSEMEKIRKNLIDAQHFLLTAKELAENQLDWTLRNEGVALDFVNEALVNWPKVFQLTAEEKSHE
jgi:hypothetical protein